MKAMVLDSLADVRRYTTPLRLHSPIEPIPTTGEILLCMTRYGVLHTVLGKIEGRTPPPQMPVSLRHQLVGFIIESGGLPPTALHSGQCIDGAWIASACGQCQLSLSG